MANRPIIVADGRGTRRALAYGAHRISLPLWARQLPTIAHEVAHTIDKYTRTPAHTDRSAHGGRFVGIFIAVAHVWGLGSVDAMLRAAIDARLVVDRVALDAQLERARPPLPIEGIR
jgi:hypothetical protein